MGWSGETESNVWQKFDIELEQEDLVRIFQENDLPLKLDERLPTRICYQLLQNEAEFLLLNKLRQFGYPADKAGDRQAKLISSTGDIIDKLKGLPA
jgi:hypothetical protein